MQNDTCNPELLNLIRCSVISEYACGLFFSKETN